MAGKLVCLFEGLKPTIAMVMIQITFGGIHVLYKLAKNDGMSMKIMIAYRMIFATASMVPLALILERDSRPRLTGRIFFLGFVLGMFGGSLTHNLYVESLVLTSATFVAAMTNLTPALTFIMAIILSIGGAMIFTFYKGIGINVWTTNINLLHHHAMTTSKQTSAKEALGALLGVGSGVSIAIWMIIQAKLSKVYPPYSATALTSICASIQSVAYAMCTEEWAAWKLGWNIRLLTVVYTGVIGSGLMIALMAWVARMRGALFISSFYPLLLIIVAIVGSLMLDELLHLGRCGVDHIGLIQRAMGKRQGDDGSNPA
ncbi:WAT1-related protein [Vitis vinifera]|uniref:WAT1-related protein n=1 Tax=Vitis vinifera TaxID=29760 RepID=A0A438CNH9_VITVI|nr:WAT1-related protein [Vitis vinifera]